MKNFDDDREERHKQREAELGDRSFVLGGETFQFRAIVEYETLRSILTATELSGGAYISRVEENVFQMLDGGEEAADRLHQILQRKDDPVTFDDLNALCTWMVEEHFRRPTQPSSLSEDGRTPTSTNSTEGPSSPLAEASAA